MLLTGKNLRLIKRFITCIIIVLGLLMNIKLDIQALIDL
jgi:hypothetical protein